MTGAVRPVRCDECGEPIEPPESAWQLAFSERPFRRYWAHGKACLTALTNRGGPPLPTHAQSA